MFDYNRNKDKIIKLQENGKYTIGFGTKFYIVGLTNRNEVLLKSIDTDKYYYEKGYERNFKRKIDLKTMCFKFDNKIFNIEDVAGIKEHLIF